MSSTTRKENREALEKASIDTGDLSGGVMPEAVFNEFFREVQESAELLSRARTIPMSREKVRVPKLGVGERQRIGRTEGEAVAEAEKAEPTSDFIQLDAEKGTVHWDVTSETMEDVINDPAGVLLDMFSTQWAVDTLDLAINGDEASADAFEAQNDGWITIATARGMPTYSHADGSGVPQAIDTSVFHNSAQQLEGRYERADPIFVLNNKQVQEYAFSLTDRQSGLGDSVLFGSADLTPFAYDVIGTPLMPQDKGLFTPASNLLYGIYRDVEVDVLTDSDEILDKDLFARYALRGRDDFEIEDENAGVLITDLATV